MVVWHRGQANIATPGGGWIFVRQPGHANTGSICPTACRASGGDICEPGTGPRDDFVVMGILGRWIVIRTESSTKIVAPATRDQTDVRRIPAVRASQTPGFEKIVQDRAFFAQTDFQPIPLGSTQGESRAPGQMRARVSCDSSFQDANRSIASEICVGYTFTSVCCAPRGSPHKTKEHLDRARGFVH